MIEFEVKAPVVDPELRARVSARGVPVGVKDQVDTYYRHPGRDFAATDEALRLRRVNEHTELTYKGPKLDRETKTRLELTTALADFDAADAILRALGFSPVATVRKRRRLYQLDRFEVAVDDVEGLGAYVEVECLVPDARDLDNLKGEAFALLAELGAGSPERRSYLELLLERQR